jgi:hypothetical protein
MLAASSGTGDKLPVCLELDTDSDGRQVSCRVLQAGNGQRDTDSVHDRGNH